MVDNTSETNTAIVPNVTIDGKTINGLQDGDILEITLTFTKDESGYKITSQQISVLRGNSSVLGPTDILTIAGESNQSNGGDTNGGGAKNSDANNYYETLGGNASELPTKIVNGIHKFPKSNKRKPKRILNKTVSYRRPNASSHLYKTVQFHK